MDETVKLTIIIQFESTAHTIFQFTISINRK
jgi:hypothetical protein